ncbi:fimbrial protein [Citrobacter arsenatis]|uniref:fimbrial protein n=1 Tax=Citrobacter arsenatis TaxID=2546350 RepID=UPI00300E4ABB
MKKSNMVITLSFFCCIANADTTVTSNFIITNKSIDSYNITSTDTTASSFDAGGGLFKITDQYQDANVNILDYGNQQLGFVRLNSRVNIVLKGKKLGHTITVNGKYANSAISVQPYGRNYFSVNKNEGCSKIAPIGSQTAGSVLTFTITSDDNVLNDCTGQSDQYNLTSVNGMIRAVGVSRDFYLDIGRLQSDPVYRNAPPDTYVGTGVFKGESIQNRVGAGYKPSYINTITIVKNPYFEGVTLNPGENVFDTRTTGSQIQGNLVIPYVINGHFTPYNTISLQVHSLNGFKLHSNLSGSTAAIPYSLSTTVGSQRVYTLATKGSGSGNVTINSLEAESYALQGRFNADFTIDKNTAEIGDYSDTLTAIFQISL